MQIQIPNQEMILNKYGITSQTIIWQEELAELSKAASKCWRDPSESHKADMSEEIADVLICIEQMRIAYDISQSTVENIVAAKYERQMNRMKNEE